MDEPRALALLSSGAQMLAQARTLEDLDQVRDLAIAAAHYARARDLGREAERYAVEIAALATLRIGKLVPAMPPDERGRKAIATRWSGKDTSSPRRTSIPAPRLAEARQIAAAFPSDDEVRQELAKMQEPSLKRLLRAARDRFARQRSADPAAPPPATCDIRLGDFREVLADIEPVDLIVTDPPYPAEYLPLWRDLGLFAKEKLKPDGLLVAMSGQLHLREVYRLLDESGLPYRWTIAYLTAGQATVVHANRIHSMWKPVVVYGSSERRLYDVVRSAIPEKDDHEWGQSESGFAELLQRVAEPGMTVCDPFLGSGTTAVVALRHGCSFVGAEIDERHYRTALSRVAR